MPKAKQKPKAKPAPKKAVARRPPAPKSHPKPAPAKIKAAKVELKKAKPAKPVKAAPPKPLTPEMLAIRARLQGMLTDLKKDIDTEVRGAKERDLAHITDTSDIASDAAEGDLALRIAESETAEAGEIERAIEKIDSGTYGKCEICNKPIGADRLHFLPYVTMCIKCQELAEIRKRVEGEELEDLATESAEADMENA